MVTVVRRIRFCKYNNCLYDYWYSMFNIQYSVFIEEYVTKADAIENTAQWAK